ncbi:beta-phosphoglucomutase [Mesoplasma seiffertii]|uniref:beta-phosphoglucomutase n=1 Tax=Mesoplasma seiffertii TaxID=28224 RepID=UPI00047994AD|nr:beta-phosphoglucomutase [Mesoplasma seiffertii]
MNIKAVIFDLDGVITDTAPLHFKAWSKTVEKVGIKKLDHSYLDNLRGVGRVQSLEKILSSHNIKLNDDKFLYLLDYKNKYYIDLLSKIDKQAILPGITNFLKELKQNNIPIAIGSASHNTKLILEKVALTEYFDEIVDPSLVANSKPFPDIFLQAAKQLEIDPKNCVVIEDAITGIIAARTAGCKTIGINVEADIKLDSTKKLNMKLLEKSF